MNRQEISCEKSRREQKKRQVRKSRSKMRVEKVANTNMIIERKSRRSLDGHK